MQNNKEVYNDRIECKKNIKYAKQDINTVYPLIINEKELTQVKINEFNGTKFKTSFQEIVDDKLNSDVYRFFYKDTIKATLDYLFYLIGNGIYIEIKDNKLSKFLPFNNLNFRNDWHNVIKLEDKYKSTKEYFDHKNKMYPIKKKFYSDNDKSKWSAMGCLIFTEKGSGKPYVNDTYWVELKNLIEQTCENRKVPDVVFFINKKDLPFLKKDRTHPFEGIVGKKHNLDIGKYYYFTPILSQSTRDEYADIPIPSSDEWNFITQKYFVNGCENKYLKTDEPNWDDKVNTAFFRGTATGCSTDLYKNPRLHITKINNDWKKNNKYNEKNTIDNVPFLDAGIIRFSSRNRAENGVLKFQKKKILRDKGVELVNFIDHETQIKFKYLIYIEGNSAAYRLSYMLSRNSVILKVESKYMLWFEHLLVPYEHYVPIKSDLSDLADIIKWCKLNDDTCKNIVKNATKFCEKYFTKSYIFDYMENIFKKISNKQFTHEENNKKYWIYKKNRKIIERKEVSIDWKNTDKNIKTAIIVPYRDNKIQNRKDQLDTFIKFWTSKKTLLKDYTYKIFIIEQTNNNDKFNRGQLCNLGVLLAEKEGYNNIIFHDVDLIPSDDLLPYYFYTSDIPIHIGNKGKKYSHYTYFGGVTAFSIKLLKKINGFPNQLWGWGGEDDIIYDRCAVISKCKEMIIPDRGTLEELYHIESSTLDTLKMFAGIKKKLIMDDIESDHKDGISHLKLNDNIKTETFESELIVKMTFKLTIK